MFEALCIGFITYLEEVEEEDEEKEQIEID